MKAHYQSHYNLAPLHTQLNTTLPPAPLIPTHSEADSNKETFVFTSRTRPNLFVLSANKYAVLKAVLKRRSYGLRYTRKW